MDEKPTQRAGEGIGGAAREQGQQTGQVWALERNGWSSAGGGGQGDAGKPEKDRPKFHDCLVRLFVPERTFPGAKFAPGAGNNNREYETCNPIIKCASNHRRLPWVP